MLDKRVSSEIARCLAESEQLSVRDVLDLRAVCKDFHLELTGKLPVSLNYRLTRYSSRHAISEELKSEQEASDEVQSMIKVTGSNICRLWVTETQLDHLHPFSALKELRLDYLRVDESDKLAKTDGDLSCLAALPELKALYVRVAMGNGIFSPFVITGLYAATQLRTLHVTGALAIVLPASLTELAFMYELDECGQRVEDPMEEETDCFRRWWATYQGALKQVDLDMQPFHQDPTHLSKMGPGSCLWEVTHLRLAFTMGGSNPFSRWGCWRLKQLQTLHLHFRETEGPICVFAPVWDLSTCTGLQYFTISIDTRRPEGLCLSRVTGVSAERFELEFLRDMGTCSPCFDCTSWALSSVSITSQHLSDVGLPMCVRDSLSAVLGSTLGSVSNPLSRITVNGMAPGAAFGAAAAQAAATAAAAQSSDSE